MKKALTLQHTKNITKSKKAQKKDPVLHLVKIHDEYRDFRTYEKKYMNEAKALVFMQDMTNAIYEDKSYYSPTQYLTKIGIPRKTYYHWISVYEVVAYYHDIILTILADRHLMHVVGDFRYINTVQGVLDPYVYKKGLELNASIKQQADEKTVQTLIVSMAKMPSTDVPLKE